MFKMGFYAVPSANIVLERKKEECLFLGFCI